MAAGIDRLPVQELRCALPTFQPEAPENAQAPVTDGGFLVERSRRRRYPIDQETGQPFMVLQTYLEPTTKDGDMMTYHHSFYYRRSPDLGGGTKALPEQLTYGQAAGKSVRVSVGEYMQRELHEELHERRFQFEPKLPKTVEDKFERAVTGAVGIRPRGLLDLTRREGDELVWLDDDTFNRTVASTGIERFRNPTGYDLAQRTLSIFFLRYAAKRDLAHVDDLQKEEFLDPITDAERKRALGYAMLMQGLEEAVDGFLPKLAEHRANGRIQPGRQDAMTELKKLVLYRSVNQAVGTLNYNLRFGLTQPATGRRVA